MILKGPGSPNALLIGGTSSAGKTTVARAISKRSGVRHLELDHELFDWSGRPALQTFREAINAATSAAPALLELLLQACVEISRDLEAELSRFVNDSEQAVVEGQWITPALASSFAGESSVRAVFIIEDDPGQALASRLRRKHPVAGRPRLPTAADEIDAQLSCQHARWLIAQCNQFKLPVVTARPYDTLSGRVLEAIGLGACRFNREWGSTIR